MKNKYSVLLIFSVIVLIIFTLNDYFIISDSSDIWVETFDGVNVSVPVASHFNINPDSNTYSGGTTGVTIWITPYVNNNTYSSIDDFFSSYMKGRSSSEIEIKGLNNNSKAFDFKPNSGITIILVSNDKKNKAIIIETASDRDWAVKIANSVVFPN